MPGRRRPENLDDETAEMLEADDGLVLDELLDDEAPAPDLDEDEQPADEAWLDELDEALGEYDAPPSLDAIADEDEGEATEIDWDDDLLDEAQPSAPPPASPDAPPKK